MGETLKSCCRSPAQRILITQETRHKERQGKGANLNLRMSPEGKRLVRKMSRIHGGVLILLIIGAQEPRVTSYPVNPSFQQD